MALVHFKLKATWSSLIVNETSIWPRSVLLPLSVSSWDTHKYQAPQCPDGPRRDVLRPLNVLSVPWASQNPSMPHLHHSRTTTRPQGVHSLLVKNNPAENTYPQRECDFPNSQPSDGRIEWKWDYSGTVGVKSPCRSQVEPFKIKFNF